MSSTGEVGAKVAAYKRLTEVLEGASKASKKDLMRMAVIVAGSVTLSKAFIETAQGAGITTSSHLVSYGIIFTKHLVGVALAIYIYRLLLRFIQFLKNSGFASSR